METINNSSVFSPFISSIANASPIRTYGKITEVIGLLIESTGPAASIGDVCVIENCGKIVGHCEVVGFRKNRTLLMPLSALEGIHPGHIVSSTKKPLMVEVGKNLLGRVLDGLGKPIDNKGGLRPEGMVPTFSKVPNPLHRKRITEVFETGIRTIDSFITVAKGQRMGIFSGSGVGKSVLMGMMARNCKSAVNVIALIGERGREVREFIERDLGEEGLSRSVVIVATSDKPALIRIKGALVAMAIAEYFRDTGADVMFMCDSLTRLAIAQREVGLAIGEPPATKGYTPSVFSLLPSFLERAGTATRGSITGLFTVLVEGDDMDEPIADCARSILDGHIVLSRLLAHRNHFPAIDVLQSISRCQNDVVSPNHLKLAAFVKNLLAAYRENEDLVQIGAYTPGTNKRLDMSLKILEPLNKFMKQEINEKSMLNESIEKLRIILSNAGISEV